MKLRILQILCISVSLCGSIIQKERTFNEAEESSNFIFVVTVISHNENALSVSINYTDTISEKVFKSNATTFTCRVDSVVSLTPEFSYDTREHYVDSGYYTSVNYDSLEGSEIQIINSWTPIYHSTRIVKLLSGVDEWPTIERVTGTIDDYDIEVGEQYLFLGGYSHLYNSFIGVDHSGFFQIDLRDSLQLESAETIQ